MQGHVERIRVKNEYNIFIRELEGKRPLERPRRRWKDNINMDIK